MADRIYLSSPHMSDEGYEMEFVKEAFVRDPLRDWTNCISIVQFV